MSPRFIVVDYNNAKSKDPRVALEKDDKEIAEKKFEELSKENEDASVILYDSQEDTVLRLTIKSEPILLVNAIEFARKRYGKSTNWVQRTANTLVPMGAKAAASGAIGFIAQRLAGGPLPGIGGAVMGHFIAPYYAAKGDGAALAGAATGMYGGLSGAIIGFVAGGPIGAFLGGVIGGVGLGTGASQLIKTLTHPNQCKDCKGTGLKGDFYRCSDCGGYGYTKGKL